jgi:ATP-dependent exoDNAse (exonuclease V) beta subunit
VVGEDKTANIPDRLFDPDIQGAMSDDARNRLARILPVLEMARAHRRRGNLRQRVETTWVALGGPAAAGDLAALEDAEAFLSLLEASEQAGDLDDANAFEETLASLYARPDPEGNERLQVMTIHKAKGLEFDTVILPGLHAGTRRSDSPLLLWMERPRLTGETELLMAPIRAAGQEEKDPLYEFVNTLAKEKNEHEQGRLLYVAVTRAIRRLELFGFVRAKRQPDGEIELKTPTSGSLLSRLWPVIEGTYRDALTRWRPAPAANTNDEHAPASCIRRFPADWHLPASPASVEWAGGDVELESEDEVIEYSWAGETARLIGVVVHRFFQQIATEGLDTWDEKHVQRQRPSIRAMLIGLGASPDTLDDAENRTMLALSNALEDDAGRWILDAHSDANNELALTVWSDDGPKTYIIDRCFVDTDGTRWVIDYKTGYREGGDIEGFMVQEVERYTLQLKRYAELMQEMENRPIQIGLYYPLLKIFQEII